LETHGKLNNGVKEQRWKFMNGTLMEERFRQLRNEGFDFAPRKTIIDTDDVKIASFASRNLSNDTGE